MDIVKVINSGTTSYFPSEELEEIAEEDGMATPDIQIQGDYSGYVPPEVVVSAGTAAPVSPRRQKTKTTKGGHVRPVSPTEVPVQVRGNLQKLGKRLKGWHQRYFEVQGSHMYYYKNHTKKDCLGEINLTNCYFCDASSAATFGHPFELHTTERTHTLAARSNDEMVQWVRVIRSNIGTPPQQVDVRKTSKPKRWESFKNALSINPRQNTSKKKKDVRLRKDRGMNRSRSQSPNELSNSQRPMSLIEDDLQHSNTLNISIEVQPSRSLPGTPLTRKRSMDFDGSLECPVSPALTLDSVVSAVTSPAHTSVEPQERQADSPSAVTTVLTVPGVTSSADILSKRSDTSKPTSSGAAFLPELLKRRFVWDEIQEVFDSLDEERQMEEYDELPPEDPVWLNHSTGIDQLRAYLLVCM